MYRLLLFLLTVMLFVSVIVSGDLASENTIIWASENTIVDNGSVLVRDLGGVLILPEQGLPHDSAAGMTAGTDRTPLSITCVAATGILPQLTTSHPLMANATPSLRRCDGPGVILGGITPATISRTTHINGLAIHTGRGSRIGV